MFGLSHDQAAVLIAANPPVSLSPGDWPMPNSYCGLMEGENKPNLDGREWQVARDVVMRALSAARPELAVAELERRSDRVHRDVVLLARCAKSQCLITYADAIAMRGQGNPQNGQWLDDAFAFAILPFGFPDLTLLVVNKATQRPSPEAFDARRSLLSKVPIDDIPREQKRCVWFQGYEEVLGPLSPIPDERQLYRLLTPEPAKEREIGRAVGNAIGRILAEGKETKRVAKAYPGSLSRTELTALVGHLWIEQRGCFALTGFPFEMRSDNEGGIQDDRLSIDRIDNGLGYSEGNIQLVTQFANRARGTLSVNDARKRLVQRVDQKGSDLE